MIELCFGCSACCFGSNAVMRSTRFWRTYKSADSRMLRQRHRVWMDHAVRKSGGKKRSVRPLFVHSDVFAEMVLTGPPQNIGLSGCMFVATQGSRPGFASSMHWFGRHTTTESAGASPECLQPEDGREPWGIDDCNAFHQEVDD